ncbi:MAG: response regulator, partial [Chitinophagaceae bacterium]
MALDGPILVIEDDPNDTDVISAALRELGVKNTVRPFNAASDALEYLLDTPDKPLIILCDVRMPGMDGLSFLKTIHQNEYLKKKTIPFIFFTVVATPDIINKAYDFGVQGFYKKAT